MEGPGEKPGDAPAPGGAPGRTEERAVRTIDWTEERGRGLQDEARSRGFLAGEDEELQDLKAAYAGMGEAQLRYELEAAGSTIRSIVEDLAMERAGTRSHDRLLQVAREANGKVAAILAVMEERSQQAPRG